MSRLLALWAWIAAGIERLRHRSARVDAPALSVEGGEDLAQRQDHGPRAARPASDLVAQPGELTAGVAEPAGSLPPPAEPAETRSPQNGQEQPKSGDSGQVAQPEELPAEPGETDEGDDGRPRAGPSNIRATPLRVDTATWQMETAREWPKWRELAATARSGQRAVEWVDAFGEVIELDLDRGRPGSGVLVLRTGTTRIEIRRSRAEVQILSLASEVEGVDRWALRWLPRFVWWLRGVDVSSETVDELVPRLREAGVRTRRIEPCVDVLGWQIKPGDERALISRAHLWAWWHDEAKLDGFGAGERHRTPNSIAVYDKIAKLRSQRGAPREALLDRWRALGWEQAATFADSEPVTRIEPRIWGDALQLEGLDATDPGAPLDREVVRVLFVDALSRHRMVDLTANAKRKRDRPELQVWELARAAGGSAEPVRLQRDVAAKQATAIRDHALRQLGRAGASVEELLHGTGDGAKALDALGRLITSPDWDADRARARSRYRELLDQERGEKTT